MTDSKTDAIVANLMTEAEAALFSAAAKGGKGDAMSTSAVDVMAELMAGLAGGKETDRIKAIARAGYVQGRLGCTKQHAFNLLEKGATRTADEQKVVNVSKTYYQRARKKMGVESTSKNAGNDAAAGTDRTDRAPQQARKTVENMPEYEVPAVPTFTTVAECHAWTRAMLNCLLEADDQKNAGVTPNATRDAVRTAHRDIFAVMQAYDDKRREMKSQKEKAEKAK